MKRIISIAAILLSCIHIMSAVPAKPGLFKYVQPDGSVIYIELHGDEFYHWTTDANGNIVEQNADGFYRPAAPDRAKARRARALRDEANSYRIRSKSTSLTTGKRDIPVLLVEFPDLKFQKTKTEFEDLLNAKGYSANGATGSVKDFFMDNSLNKFEPNFVVYNPVELDHNYAYYGNNKGDEYAALALYEACGKLNDQINFNEYDSDGDKEVDMILFYFAGYNAAEGGGKDKIWPHQWYLSSAKIKNSEIGNIEFDGVKVDRYFCSSELRSFLGNTMCGIGTTCHEFAHSLGLPDFYDTDYGDNGMNQTLYSYSTMCSGSYNNEGRTPPYFNALERNMLGWMDEPQEITAKDEEYRLLSIDQNAAFKTQSSIRGEYFIYECRGESGWDRYITGTGPDPGLIVYHVDKSDRIVPKSGKSAADLWNNGMNMINAYGGHPCFYIVTSSKPTAKDSSFVFPGTYGIRTYTPVDWDKNNVEIHLSDIAYSSGKSSFKVTVDKASISGYVKDIWDQPVKGALVRLSEVVDLSSSAGSPTLRANAPAFLSTDIKAYTDENGCYTLQTGVKDYILNIAAGGYDSYTEEVSMNAPYQIRDLVLNKVGENGKLDLYKRNSSTSRYRYRLALSAMYSTKFTAEELKAYVGNTLHSVRFAVYGDTESAIDSAYVIVAYEKQGKQDVHHIPIDNFKFSDPITVDISSANLTIPEEQAIYIGYALKNCTSPYHAYIWKTVDNAAGGNFYSGYDLHSPTWESYGEYNLDISIATAVHVPVNLSSLGIISIVHGQQTYKTGSEFELKLTETATRKPVNVKWYYDGKPVEAEATSITLEEAGLHTVKADLTFHDGTAETLILKIRVL